MENKESGEEVFLEKGLLVFSSNRKHISTELPFIFKGFLVGFAFLVLAVFFTPNTWGYRWIFDFMIYFLPFMTLGISIPILVVSWAYCRVNQQKVVLFQNRLDYSEGVINRVDRSIWLYEIKSVKLTSSPFDTLTSNRRLHVSSAQGTISFSGPIGNFRGTTDSIKIMEKLKNYIVEASTEQRFAIKGRLT